MIRKKLFADVFINSLPVFGILQYIIQLDITGTIYFIGVGLSNEYWQVMKRPTRLFYREPVAALFAIKFYSPICPV